MNTGTHTGVLVATEVDYSRQRFSADADWRNGVLAQLAAVRCHVPCLLPCLERVLAWTCATPFGDRASQHMHVSGCGL